jgi:hypothetical protein
MNWIRKVYIPEHPIKHHIVHPDVSEVVDSDIEGEHECSPTKEEQWDTLRIDPGGSIMMNNEPITKSFGGFRVSVKPEHIFGANIIWSDYAVELEGLTDQGEKVVRVGMDSFTCAVMPESIYVKIGGWLASISALGQAAREEIAAAFEDIENYHVYVPESEVDEFEN